MTIAVYLVQPNYQAVINDKPNYWLPYSIGMVWSYAIQDSEIAENYHLEKLIYIREDIDKVARSIIDNSVIAFSCYLWNWEYNLALAKRIRQYAPNVLIVFGGPQVPNRPLETNFFKRHPYIDSVVLTEGEISFTECLKKFINGHKKKIYQASRLNDLNIPSPYLTGLFDQLILDNPGVLWNTTLETNRGCPFHCTFCDWGSLTYSKVKKFDEERVYSEIEWIGKHGIDYLVLADANFGIFKERDYKIANKLCETKRKYNFPTNINIPFTKNSNSYVVDMVKLFNDSNMSRGMTISFQSLDETVLSNIKRTNMDINNAGELFKLLDQNQLTHYSELILGLPAETVESWSRGLINLISMGQHQCIDVFYATLLENSEMNHPAYKDKFGIKSVEVENFMHTNFIFDNDIAEKMLIIKETNTMSTSSLIDAYMFSWIIVNFHCYGWTQIYSRFFNVTSTISYKEFYSDLQTYIINNNMGVISELYQKYKGQLDLYINNNAEFIRMELNQDILRDAQQYFHKNKTEIELLINDFIKLKFNDNLFTALTEYQHYFVSSKNYKYPYIVNLDIGINRTITLNEPYISDIQSCMLTLTGEFFSESEFLSKLVTWRRNGWGKVMMNTVENFKNNSVAH